MPYFNFVRTIGPWGPLKAWGPWRLGFTHDLVLDAGEPYLERWIIWCGITLRLHKFHKGDDDRAFHDHPWWFVTLPLQSYREITPVSHIHEQPPQQRSQVVKRWRPHWRRAKHRHIVQLIHNRPVYTLIVTGPKSKEWGFWDGGEFVHHEHWLSSQSPADTATNSPT